MERPRWSASLGGSAKVRPQSPEVTQRRRGAGEPARERAHHPRPTFSLTVQSGLSRTGPALGQARVGSGVESVPQPGAAPPPECWTDRDGCAPGPPQSRRRANGRKTYQTYQGSSRGQRPLSDARRGHQGIAQEETAWSRTENRSGQNSQQPSERS
jgi:hypothetical protein